MVGLSFTIIFRFYICLWIIDRSYDNIFNYTSHQLYNVYFMKLGNNTLIFTEPTDQKQARCGYCLSCYRYNEVWTKDSVSVCQCGAKMHHLKLSDSLITFFALIFYLMLIFFS